MKVTLDIRRPSYKPHECPVIGLHRFHNEGRYSDDVPYSYTYYTLWIGPTQAQVLINWVGTNCD